MGKNTNFVSHKKSKLKENGGPKLPLAADLVEGEIAINFGKDVETLSIKNESGDVVTFSSDNYYTEKKLGSGFTGENSGVTVTDVIGSGFTSSSITDVIIENEEIVSAALNDLDERKLDASAYTPSVELWESGSGVNSAVLKGSSGTASGDYSVAEGLNTSATSQSSHAEGGYTTASGVYSHAEGEKTSATSYDSHAEGCWTLASGSSSHAEGQSTKANGNYSHAEGYSTTANAQASHAEGSSTVASGESSHAEGINTKANGYASHVEGYDTIASGSSSHAEGESTTASGNQSHAEGYYATANGNASHAEGGYTTANGSRSHAEGANTTASGQSSHAEGNFSTANGNSSHAEGSSTIANGNASHTEGINTETRNIAEHASGQFNSSYSATTSFGNSGNTLFSVGNGSAPNARHNAFEIRQNGDIYITSGGTTASTAIKLQDTIGSKADKSDLGGLKLVKVTQAEYDALTTKDPNTLYVIVN